MGGIKYSKNLYAERKIIGKSEVENVQLVSFDKDNDGMLTAINHDGFVTTIGEYNKISRTGKDVNGIFTTVVFKDNNDVTRKTSVLSKSDPLLEVYDVRTVTYFDSNGTQLGQKVYNMTYDVDGDLIGEVSIWKTF